jgi:hypothetical protein
LGELAHELTFAVCDDEGALPRFVMLRDVDFAGQHHDDAGTDVPDSEDCFTRSIRTDLAESAYAFYIFGIQHRKHLVTSGINNRARGKGHLLSAVRRLRVCGSEQPNRRFQEKSQIRWGKPLTSGGRGASDLQLPPYSLRRNLRSDKARGVLLIFENTGASDSSIDRCAEAPPLRVNGTEIPGCCALACSLTALGKRSVEVGRADVTRPFNSAYTFQLVPRERKLLLGNGPIHIGSRALAILVALVERGDHCLS